LINEEITIDLRLDNSNDNVLIFGVHDKNLRLIEEELSVRMTNRGEILQIRGACKAVKIAKELIVTLQKILQYGEEVSPVDFVNALKMAQNNELSSFIGNHEDEILKTRSGKIIKAKNLRQSAYIEAVNKRDVVFGLGPAGVGKTFLAVALAISFFKKAKLKRIILTRPAVEAGERLGFLPGDLKEKVDPYLRPVYDAMYTILGKEQTERLIERGTIEIAPLAYMRGRTLDDAFVILDEAQNTTKMQMKMFLTRLGFNSKMIINGDSSQVDLPHGATSGLIHAEKILQNIKKISFVYFSHHDVIRHPVVAEIIKAYDKQQKE